jgi:Domain of unknown function (DUF383)/Domain of unknown function (DUF384)
VPPLLAQNSGEVKALINLPMDTDTLGSLTQLLSGAQSVQIRVATATAVAAATSGDANAETRAAVGQYVPLLRRLLALRGDPSAGRFVLSALINIAEDEGAAKQLIALRAVASCASALLDPEQREMSSLYNGLLANLTRLPEGVDALTGAREEFDDNERRVAEATLLRLAANMARFTNALFLANACSTKRGREVLLSNSENDPRKQPLNSLLQLLCDSDKDRRLAAASALRNCALDEDCHPALVERTDVLGVALVRLMSPGHPVESKDMEGAPKEVLKAVATPMTLVPEPFAEIRLMIVEAFLLLCKSLAGRNALRTCKAYPILREWHLEESDEGVKEAVEQIVDRTELLTEEGEGEPVSLNGNTDDGAENEASPAEVSKEKKADATDGNGSGAKLKEEPSSVLERLGLEETNPLLDTVD